jgi:Caspase domain
MNYKPSLILVIFFCFLLVFPQQVTATSFENENPQQEQLFKTLNVNTNISFIPSVLSSNESLHIFRHYYALLVGISDYSGVGGDLPFSVKQINAFKKTLLKGGNWCESNIKTLTNNNATKSTILTAIETMAAQENKNDLSIIYLVGHGGSNATGEVFITYQQNIRDTELASAVEHFNGYLVIIIDCCHSGGFIEELKGRKRIILTACSKNELTYQYSELQSGFFGYFLNLTLEKYTKTTETTFLFACPLTIRYSQQLSQELGANYTVHPLIYDGTVGLMKLINRHQNITSLKTILVEPFLKQFNLNFPRRIWRQ